MERLDKFLCGCGAGTRSQVKDILKAGRVTVDGNPEKDGSRKIDPAVHTVTLDGQPLGGKRRMVVMLNKPAGVTCSTKGQGKLVYDLLPKRFRLRTPVVSTVGRLDRDTSGLLLFTDDGQLLHKIISPKSKLPKVYIAELANDLRGDEAAMFASGSLMLESETTPLLPAEMEVLGPRRARLTLHEGRYHQVRRMFVAVGNHVAALHRERVGGLTLGDLPEGDWRLLGDDERAQLMG